MFYFCVMCSLVVGLNDLCACASHLLPLIDLRPENVVFACDSWLLAAIEMSSNSVQDLKKGSDLESVCGSFRG